MWDPACYLMNYLVNLKLIFKKINYQNLWMAKKKKKEWEEETTLLHRLVPESFRVAGGRAGKET